jgi:hypothetical protein
MHLDRCSLTFHRNRSVPSRRFNSGGNPATGQYPCTQTAPLLHRDLRARRECLTHPKARFALGDACKCDALKFKLLTNQSVEIQSACDGVAPEHARRFILHAKLPAEILINFPREEGDLALVVVFVI